MGSAPFSHLYEEVLQEPRPPCISIDLGSSGVSVRVTRFAPAGTRIEELFRYLEDVPLCDNSSEHRPANDCIMYMPPQGDEAPFVLARHSQGLDEIAGASSVHLLGKLETTGTGGCIGLDGQGITVKTEGRKIDIPGYTTVPMQNRTHVNCIRRVNDVKAPLYRWISDSENAAVKGAGGSALDLPKLRDFTLKTTFLRASAAGAVGDGGGAAAAAGEEGLGADVPVMKVWAGLYRDFILRAAAVLLEKDARGKDLLKDDYLRSIRVTVCLPADGETKFPWPLSYFIYDAIALATAGLGGKFAALADIQPKYQGDVLLAGNGGSSGSGSGSSGGGCVLARAGSSRIILCSESRAVMQYLFTQSIRNSVKDKVDSLTDLPPEMCVMVIDPGHGTTDVCIVQLNKVTLKVVKYLRSDFGAPVGGRDVDRLFEGMVLAPFLEGMGQQLEMDDVCLNDFKVKHGAQLDAWFRKVKQDWDGNTDGVATLRGDGKVALSFGMFKSYLAEKEVHDPKTLAAARKAGLARALEHEGIKAIRRQVQGLIPPLSFKGEEAEDLMISGPVLKACFDKLLGPLKVRMEEACAHKVLPRRHEVHLLCLAGGASNSKYLRGELETMVRALGRAAPSMPPAIHMDKAKMMHPPEQLPCLGALVDAWLRPNDVVARESCFMFTRYTGRDKVTGKPLKGAELASKLREDLAQSPEQDGLSAGSDFFRDLDSYIKEHLSIDYLRIAVPIASKGMLYCPSSDIPRYLMGSPDYALEGVGKMFVGTLDRECRPDEYREGRRIVHERFLALPQKVWKGDKGKDYQRRALTYKGKPLVSTADAISTVLRSTMDAEGRFKHTLLDLKTGATENTEVSGSGTGGPGEGGGGSNSTFGGDRGVSGTTLGKRRRTPVEGEEEEKQEEEEEEEEDDSEAEAEAGALNVLVNLFKGLKK